MGPDSLTGIVQKTKLSIVKDNIASHVTKSLNDNVKGDHFYSVTESRYPSDRQLQTRRPDREHEDKEVISEYRIVRYKELQ